MTTVDIAPGICGFVTHIECTADDMFIAHLDIESQCAHIKQMAEMLKEVSAFDEIRKPITETATYQAAASAKCHAACPVPCAVIKALEVAAGLALPKDVQISICKE